MKRSPFSDFAAVEFEQGRISNFRPRRPGFTLVELMVSVALAIIIITLFATIYTWSTDTYATQKGIRRNDQRSRMLVTVIKGDLENRTFIDVVPFWPGQRTDSAPPAPDFPPGPRYNSAEREGYFCISENDPNNHSDDVLYITVKIPKDSTQRRFTGRATLLRPNPPPTMLTNEQYLIQNPNQPELDDGQVVVNGGVVTGSLNNAGSSRAAEVAYFLRNGNLYRRVLLIRDPYNGPTTPIPAQPTGFAGDYDSTKTTTGSGYFWRDFAYSAYYDAGLKFHGLTVPNSLDNQNPPGSGVTSAGFPVTLGIPPFRFGHSLGRPLTAPTYEMLRPREYVGSGAAAKFFGRFLTDETAHSSFLFPGAVPAGMDPHVRTDLTLNPSTQMIDQYYGYDNNPAGESTAHRGEAILMTNVHAFDIRVWDRNLGQFVQLGHDLPAVNGVLGEFHYSRNLRDSSGFPGTNPDRFVWNRFDTWNPSPAIVDPASAAVIPPPYKSKRDPTTGAAIPATSRNDPYLGADEDTNGNGTLDATELDNNTNGMIDAERPLLAIQITIRFFDPTTRQMRQLTIQHSLKK